MSSGYSKSYDVKQYFYLTFSFWVENRFIIKGDKREFQLRFIIQQFKHDKYGYTRM